MYNAYAPFGKQTHHTIDVVQNIDISTPATPIPIFSVADEETISEGLFDTLEGARAITTVVIGDKIYALVAAYKDDGIQIMRLSTSAFDPDYFVTKWTTTRNNERITFPEVGSYTINWGDEDESAVENATGEASHTYATAGTYTVEASNSITAFSTGSDAVNAVKLTSI